MNKKKIPLRSCVITRERVPKQDLIRIVKNNKGKVFVDEEGKANGRGAYLKKDLAVIKRAKSERRLDEHLKVMVPDTIYEELEVLISEE